MKCNCESGNNKPVAHFYSQVQHYKRVTMNRSDLSTNGDKPMRTTLSAQPAPIKSTILQIVLLLAAFGTSGTMFAATLV